MQLLLGDCLELMEGIPDGSVDMVLCDRPYGATQCKWDKRLPMDALWQAYKRVCKPDCAILLFGTEPFSSLVRTSNLSWFKYDWYWRKPRGTGHLNAKRQPMRDIEIISVFCKRATNYHPQLSKGSPYFAKSSKEERISRSGETTYGDFKNGNAYRNENPGIRYPKQLLEFGVVERGNVHPTQKPVPLLEYLIKTYTNKGYVVLDNCMGSGSTGVACVRTGRDFIGMEIEPKYFEIAKERIENTQKEGVQTSMLD